MLSERSSAVGLYRVGVIIVKLSHHSPVNILLSKVTTVSNDHWLENNMYFCNGFNEAITQSQWLMIFQNHKFSTKSQVTVKWSYLGGNRGNGWSQVEKTCVEKYMCVIIRNLWLRNTYNQLDMVHDIQQYIITIFNCVLFCFIKGCIRPKNLWPIHLYMTQTAHRFYIYLISAFFANSFLS